MADQRGERVRDRLGAVVKRHPAAVVVGVAVVLRLIAWSADLAARTIGPHSDMLEYLAMADAPSGYWDSDAANWTTGFRRPPGYPALLAIPRLLSDELLVSALVGVATGVLVVWLCWRLGRMVAGPTIGFIAGLVVAVDPNSIVQSTMLLSDTTYAALMLAGLWAFGRGLITRATAAMAVAGLLLGVAVLVRPIGLFLPFALVLASVIGMALFDRRRVSMVPVVVFLLVAALPVGGWWLRNVATEGANTISTVQGVNLLEYRAASSVAEETGREVGEVQVELRRELSTRLGAGAGLGDEDRERSALGIEVIRDHPRGYLQQAAEGATRTLSAPGRTELRLLAGDLPWPGLLSSVLQAVSVGLSLALCLGGVVGSAILARRRDWIALTVLAVPVVSLLVVGSGLDSDSRFRIPLTPLLAILTAIAADAVRRRWRTRRSPIGAGP